MKKFIYFFLALLVAFVSCEKDNLETNSTDATQETDALTDFDLRGSKKFVTIVGQNSPTEDIAAVQEAVDNYDRIKLEGTFDFGSDEFTGGVDINRPNVIIKGPARIVNGAKTEVIPELGPIKYPLSIRMPGVVIRNLEIEGDHDGILIYAQEDGRPVILFGNSIKGSVASVAATATPGGIKIFKNTMESLFNFYGIETTGNTQIINNDMKSGVDCVFLFGFDHRLDVLFNTMSTTGFDGMFIGSWWATSVTGPDSGSNPPVKIIGNRIDVDGPDAAGIVIGTSAHGLNNALVRGNKITGNAGFSGILKEPYGHNNRIINNDLRGLTSYGPQLWLMGSRDNLFLNNKLGKVEPIPGGGFVAAFQNAATLVSTINWHEFDGLDTPDPVNYGNRFIHNDYSQTGVAGWSEDPDSYGAVLLLDFLQKFDPAGNPVEEPFVMKNYIAEKKFPAGTDVCDQVLDLNPGSNYIAGSEGCEAGDKKSTVALSAEVNKHYSKLLMERHQRKEAAIKEAWGRR